MKDPAPPKDRPPPKDPPKDEFDWSLLPAGLNRVGRTGWEVVGIGENGVLCRKSLGEGGWEYKMLKVPDSTLNGKSNDDETLQLVLVGLALQGWEVCSLHTPQDGKGSSMILKRAIKPPSEKKDPKPAGPPE